MIFFNNAKFLLLFICFTASFQALPSFFCCGDDTTIDTQIKPNKETGRPTSSLTAAIVNNRANLNRIAEYEEKLKSQKLSTESNKKTSSKESTLTENIVETQKNNPNNQKNSPVSENLIPNASADQSHTEAHPFHSDSGKEQSPLYSSVKKEDAFSPKENSNQNNNNIATQRNFDPNNTIMLPQTLPSLVSEFNDTLEDNYNNQPDDFVEHGTTQYQGIGIINIAQHPLNQGLRPNQKVIFTTVRQNTLSGNNSVLYRSSSSSESNSPILSILNNLPHMPQEDFDNDQN